MNDSLVATWNALTPDKRKAFAELLRRKGIDVYTQLPVPRCDRDAELPLSYAQQRLWFLAQLEPDSAAYNISGAFAVDAALDPARVQSLVDTLVARHEVLRSAFHATEDGRAEQRIVADARCRVTIQASGDLAALVTENATRAFELAAAPLLRVTLVRQGERRCALLFAMHHIISDGLSLDLLLEEFVQLYAGATLPALPIQYLDYAEWQRERLSAGELDRQLRYWVAQLAGEPQPLELPADKPRTSEMSGRGAVHTFRVDASLSARVLRCARDESVTVFMLLLTVFDVLLYRWCGQRDLRVGVPAAGRPRLEFERIVGLFVNTHVLRSVLRGDEPFRALLGRVKEAALGAQAHADLPFERLVDALAPERALGRNPLFQVMYNHETQARAQAGAPDAGLRITPLQAAERTTQFELVLDTAWDEQSGQIIGAFSYATDLFEARTIATLAERFENLLEQVVSQPARFVAQLEFEPSPQVVPAPIQVPAALVTERIAERARQTPAAIAVQCGADTLTYAQLEHAADGVARRLRESGVGVEQRVGLCVARSPRMLVGALGIWKAGAAYVPLDPAQPVPRLRAIMQDAGTALLVTESSHPLADAECLLLDALDSATPAAAPLEHSTIHREQLAYVIYTSGSTGVPKGVAVSHGALAAHAEAVLHDSALDATDRALHFASMSVDAGVEQWVAPLIAGARLVLRDDALWSAEQCADVVRACGVTRVDLPPQYLLEVANWLNARAERVPLRSCTSGGEALPQSSIAPILRAFAPAELINAYGPTEAVITPLTWHARSEDACSTPYAPLGAALGGRACRVLDADLNSVSPGAVGELYLAGSLLARGYWANSARTAERFLPDPWSSERGGRMYRTGDLVRCHRDGTLEFVGRADHQVKLRGHRIEPGEIEALLLREPGVREAAVLLSAARLVAYVAGDAEPAALRSQLAAAVPDFMVPSSIIVLAELPRTVHGKLDRARLPATELPQRSYVAPRTAEERVLCEIWQTVLSQPRVSVTDNFFELGGDSIVSIQVVSRARQAGLGLTPRHVFQHQTVEALARVATRVETLQIEQGPARGEAPLTPIQLEFLAQPSAGRDHHNQSVLLRCRTRLSPERLAAAFATLLSHHDALRFIYHQEAERWTQTYGDLGANPDVLWVRTAESGAEVEALCEAAQRSLCVARGELMRALYIERPDGTSRLLIAAHHLAVDGVSFRILLEDLERAYAGVPLPPKTSAFASYGRALRDYAQRAPLDVWTRRLAAAGGDPHRDFAVDGGTIADQSTLEMRLDRDATQRLLQTTPAAYRTQIQDLLLLALARAADVVLGVETLAVELESHGREPISESVDVSRTVGWFTSKAPVRIDARGDLPDAIKRVKEQLRALPDRGLGHGVLGHFGTPEQRAALAALPAPKIAFNYLGQFDGVFEADSPFEIAVESHGAEFSSDTPLEHWIEINGQVYAGALSLGFAFDRRMYRDESMSAFVSRYEAELRAVIAHCCEPEAFGRTPSDYAAAKLSQAQLDAIVGEAPGADDIYPLTPMQRGLLFHSLYAPEEAVYVTQLDAAVSGIDPVRFLRAWQRAIDRHPVLRTSFVWRGLGVPLQRVHATASLPSQLVDLRGSEDPVAALADLKRAEHARRFELESAPLFRVALARLDGDRYHFVWTCHHLLLDGWSTTRLLDEVLLDYLGRDLPPPTGRFAEYLAWLSGRDAGASETFWRSRLPALSEPTLLRGSLPAARISTERQLVHTQLSAAATSRLSEFAQRERVTMNSVVQAAWSLLLQRYTGRDAVAFGATVSGRPDDLAGAEQMLGLFINTLPVIVEPRAEWSVRELIQRVQADNLAMREHEHTPLADIQRWAGLGAKGLFDTLLVFENYPVDKALGSTWDGLEFGEVGSFESTHYALTIALNLSDRLDVEYGFESTAFDRAQIETLGACLLRLLDAFVAVPERRLGELALPTEQRALQLRAASVPDHALFLDRALCRHAAGPRRTALAVVGEREQLSWLELEQASNRLAHRLLRLGVQRDRCVGVCLPRDASFVVSALAIWKAGAAYLPLDPRQPPDRLRFMIEDAGVAIVITCEAMRELAGAARTLCLDREDLTRESVARPDVRARSGEDLAYVIYTSGSTGTPKGVAVSHAAISMHCHAVADIYAIRPDDCALHFAPFGFDASVEQWVVVLLGGGRLRVSDDQPWAPEALDALIERERITIVYPPMSHVLSLAQSLDARGQRRRGLRVICVGGEAVPQRSLQLLRSALAPELIVNGYGPTETVVTPLLWAAGPELACDTAYAPIGHVVGDRSAYVLDRDLNILPAGATGELYIGGTGLARGYYARSQLTAERFLPDPFTAEAGARMYRTGDLVRMLGDGSIEYLARADHQVKLRGFRIELGEIEAALLEQPGVVEAYALVHEEGVTKSLIGYVAGAAPLEPAALLAQLRTRLPEHMLPRLIIALPELPRTRHGKVDRARLPRPDVAGRAYEAPEGDIERTLAELWVEILGVERIGRTDNFFELGGDSILSILVVSRARERGLGVTPRQLFSHPTLAQLASVATRATSPLTAADSGEGEVPLTPIQHVFFADQPRDRHHFNLSVLLRPKRALDPGLLERALRALVAHHSALRLRYVTPDGAVEQVCLPVSELSDEPLLVREHVQLDAIEAACQRVQRSLNLERGPLLRACQMVVPDGSERLLLTVHHLAVDGVSFRLLLEDLQTAYGQLAHAEVVRLPPSSSTFKAWSERLVEYASSAMLADELAYWQRELGSQVDLPQDQPAADGSVRTCSMTLDPHATRALLRLAPSAFSAQVQDVLLAGLARALSHWTGFSEHLVELEGHGRDTPFDDLDLTRCVGWFTRLYPLRLGAADTAAELARAIKHQREQLRDGGLSYGVLSQLAPAAVREAMQALPRPRITFNYLGQFDASFDEAAVFTPATEAAGDEVSPNAALANWLQFDAEVYGDRFGCTLLYDAARFDAQTMSRLLEAFRAELEAIARTASQLAGGVLVAHEVPRGAREADDMALKPRQYSTSPLVQLAAGNHAAPIFCLHPAGGVVFDYHILARRLAGRRTVYGVQCRTLIDPTWVDQSIEDMCSAYARLIVDAQPEGPYHLLGWSLGADLAIETASILEQTGRQVAFLGLVDRLVQDDPDVPPDAEDETDVLMITCNLLSARYPAFARKELLLEAFGLRKRGQADREIVRALVGRVTGASPDAQEAFDLEGLLVMHQVLQNMNRIAARFALKPLHVAPHCWWSSDALRFKESAVRELEEGIGQRSAYAVDVPSNHMQIVYDEQFVSTLAAVLRTME